MNPIRDRYYEQKQLRNTNLIKKNVVTENTHFNRKT